MSMADLAKDHDLAGSDKNIVMIMKDSVIYKNTSDNKDILLGNTT